LPVQLRHCNSLGQFKRLLKTYLFGGWDRGALWHLLGAPCINYLTYLLTYNVWNYTEIQGMVYLHKSVFQSHGYLSSANCHVDSRWVLKVSGFALHAFRNDNCKEQVVHFYRYFCCGHLLIHISISHMPTVTVIWFSIMNKLASLSC